MENSSTELLDLLLAGGAALAALGAAVVAALRWTARRRIGPVQHVQRAGAIGTRLVVVLAVLAAALVAMQWSELSGALASVALASSVVTAWTSPSSRSSALGELGVSRGWHARRFEELEEWRLTGDHLRWKLFGEWQAAPAPPDVHAELRAKLATACPGRESRFSG